LLPIGIYLNEDNDKKFNELRIKYIQTMIYGWKSKVDMKIEETKEGEY
jgi:hypothetical protein